jgi:hypothetical protein
MNVSRLSTSTTYRINSIRCSPLQSLQLQLQLVLLSCYFSNFFQHVAQYYLDSVLRFCCRMKYFTGCLPSTSPSISIVSTQFSSLSEILLPDKFYWLPTAAATAAVSLNFVCHLASARSGSLSQTLSQLNLAYLKSVSNPVLW